MGQKYAAYNAGTPIPLWLYDSDESPVPAGVDAIEITDEQWGLASTIPGYSVVDGVLTAPAPVTAAAQLASAQTTQASVIDVSYLAAIQVDVSFTTAAGVTKAYQADCVSNSGTDSQSVLLKTVTGYDIAGGVPSGFAWKSSDNTMVTFTLTDLKGLYAAMLTQGQVAFTKRATLKAEIAAITDTSAAGIAAVQAIVWAAS